jgi:hypothetical protein
MLTSGGLLGLLLMGAAVGGLLTALHGERDGTEDDMPPDDDRSGSDLDGTSDEDAGVTMADWLPNAEAADDPALPAPDVAGSRLSNLLFGSATPSEAAEAPFGPVLSDAPPGSATDDAPAPQTRALVPVEAATTDASDAAAPGGQVDVLRVIEFGPGPAIPLVTEFAPETDRLILDFEGSAEDAPVIGVDLETSPGDALILADGVPVTFVAGAAGLSTTHVDVVMIGDDAATDAYPATRPAAGIGSIEALEVIRGFDPATQQIEIDYDPAVFADPHLAIRTAEDGSGAQILLDGQVVVSVAGTMGLDPDAVVLRAV